MRHTFRMTLCRLVGEAPGQTTEELIKGLSLLYPNEGQVRSAGTHLQALRAVGIVRVSSEELHGSEEHPLLVQHWELTPSGKKKLEHMLA